jgi:hypothetical protein
VGFVDEAVACADQVGEHAVGRGARIVTADRLEDRVMVG